LERQFEVAIIGGIDTLLDRSTLEWLEILRRLKSPAMPVGLAPGEVGVFFVLETLQRAQQRGVKPLACIRSVAIAEEEKTYFGGDTPTGVTLAQLLRDCGKLAEWQAANPCWIVSDHNGEAHRAMEWGNALVRAIPDCEPLRQPLLWYPAISVGETYAASGAVAIAFVLHSWMRRYAIAKHAVALQSSDGPQRSAIVLSQAA
jgi:3-oxoacyl-[acyl-carrier-protein] synthase-1